VRGRRSRVLRALTALGVAVCGFFALAGGVVLHGPYLLIPLIVAGLVAAVAFGVREEGGKPAAVTALIAAGATMAVVMVVTGLGLLAGGTVATAVTLTAAAVTGLGWLLTGRRRRPGGDPAAAPARHRPATVPLPGRPDRSPLPVSLLPTPDLGTEWVRTTAALAGRLEPAARQEIVRRRAETLDELERRDPSGFARWLTAERGAHGDPAAFVRGHRTMGTDAA
jgi:hypothetical protein